MAYPDWVLKHKIKGTYINCVGDKYYLYAAHSERILGTKKVKRVSDGSWKDYRKRWSNSL